MKGKFSLAGISSLFVTNGGLFFLFAATVVSGIVKIPALAGLFLFIFLLSLLSRIWGKLSLKGLELDIQSSEVRMFRGNAVDVTYCIKNNKLLPLIWLELIQDMPRRQCVMPESGFESYEHEARELENEEKKVSLMRKFSFLMPYQTLRWTVPWRGLRRGVYALDRVSLRTGDGFGLTHAERQYEISSCPTFTVYPDIRPVDISLFLRTQWECTSGAKGYMDDTSVLRGIRKYQNHDSWKHINWRVAARQHELQVNLYETIMPKSSHFIVDGESFLVRSEEDEELEHMLSTLGSLFMALKEAGVSCSLSLPQSCGMPPINTASGAEELLFYLACYDFLAAVDEEKTTNPASPVFKPSNFEEDGALALSSAAGATYFLTYNISSFTSSGLAAMLDPARLTVISYCEMTEEEELFMQGMKTVLLSDLERGG